MRRLITIFLFGTLLFTAVLSLSLVAAVFLLHTESTHLLLQSKINESIPGTITWKKYKVSLFSGSYAISFLTSAPHIASMSGGPSGRRNRGPAASVSSCRGIVWTWRQPLHVRTRQQDCARHDGARPPRPSRRDWGSRMNVYYSQVARCGQEDPSPRASARRRKGHAAGEYARRSGGGNPQRTHHADCRMQSAAP